MVRTTLEQNHTIYIEHVTQSRYTVYTIYILNKKIIPESRLSVLEYNRAMCVDIFFYENS